MLLDAASLSTRFAASREEMRLQLRGILVEKHRTVATDGHRLAVVAHPGTPAADFPAVPGASADSADFAPILLPGETADAVAKALPRGRTSHAILRHALLDETAAAARRLSLHVTDLDSPRAFGAKVDDRRFPDYAKVMPHDPVAFEIRLNASYIADAARIAAACADERSAMLTFRLRTEDGAVEIRGGSDRMLYIVMPLRPDREAGEAERKAAREWNRAEAAISSLCRTAKNPDVAADLATAWKAFGSARTAAGIPEMGLERITIPGEPHPEAEEIPAEDPERIEDPGADPFPEAAAALPPAEAIAA